MTHLLRGALIALLFGGLWGCAEEEAAQSAP